MRTELENLIRAQHKLISLHSTDERVEFQAILDVARDLERNVQDWTVTTGVRVFSTDAAEPASVAGTDKPELALQYLMRQKRPLIATFRGLAPHTKQPVLRRLLQDYVAQADGRRECAILLDDEELHPRVQRQAVTWRPRSPPTG